MELLSLARKAAVGAALDEEAVERVVDGVAIGACVLEEGLKGLAG